MILLEVVFLILNFVFREREMGEGGRKRRGRGF